MGADVGRQRRVVIGQPAVGTEHEDAMGVEANGAVAAAQGELGANDRLVALMVPGHALDDEAEVWSDAEPIEIRLHHGAPLSIVRKPDGQMTVEARVLRGDGLNVWLEAFTISNPHGERREVISHSWASGRKAAALKRAGTVLTTKQLEEER